MEDKEFEDAMEFLTDLGDKRRLREQNQRAANVERSLGELKAVFSEFVALEPTSNNYMVWASSKEFIDQNQRGLSTDELIDVGTSLLEIDAPGLKMAAVELIAEALQSEVGVTGIESFNGLMEAFGKRTHQISPELPRVSSLVTDFRSSISELFKSAPVMGQAPAPEELKKIIRAARIKRSVHNLESWREARLKDIADSHSSESVELMSEVPIHPDIDSALASICNEQVIGKIGGRLWEAISDFTFGMAMEIANQARLEDETQWTLQRAVASAAASLVTQGVLDQQAIYYIGRFYDAIFRPDQAKAIEVKRAWIDAGVRSMYRMDDSGSFHQFAVDFNKCYQLIEAGNQLRKV